ncbi:hypothetical protein [Halalkalicoccus jeotgali]|uniref:Uncharacterized protein n=1 Tax=Halalkalicoccus jeotgali (strain DSM 18796 / CECT 7217 / JCM 14584 / KCTC 4019 / B3) TaxID=795797 RepID=D8J3U4_HALJB|nr:hypothetical protein [Halalkalicoccus jeotgali]ADJ13435.1 hypothetical protein HacjB3_00210 [Halalkalicoccus jeotgali B3]ELY33090.1 hypothetical protein C497_19122 [Halalkalicoccus jeotgali B3]
MVSELDRWFQPRNRTEVIVGLVVGYCLVGLLVSYWGGGIDWDNPAVIAWVGTVTSVTVGALIGAFGIVTGDYYRRREPYLTGMKVFGAIALLSVASIAVV